ncbi:hypothetical protein ANCDUO_18611 [Ancylostoma duodenale]|uniref:Uncharacterized protein n=1 Tax=Ancylostoma duodenale TaxID=51022 RepID=A0A0C2FRV2_9BILA|nr:hypothetical protein ANCDUO_18611 [Ancylostoma duodenale]
MRHVEKFKERHSTRDLVSPLMNSLIATSRTLQVYDSLREHHLITADPVIPEEEIMENAVPMR